jgi:hypothetical protein
MWILLIFAVSNYSSTANSQMAVEFNNKEACTAAETQWHRQFSGSIVALKTLCVSKGEKK